MTMDKKNNDLDTLNETREAGENIFQGIFAQYSGRTARRKTIAILSVIVVLFTMNTLTFDALTLERHASCGTPEHEHTEVCYDEDNQTICSIEDHSHTDACFQQKPVKPAQTALDDFVAINATISLSNPLVSVGDGPEAAVGETTIVLGGDTNTETAENGLEVAYDAPAVELGDVRTYAMSAGTAFLSDILHAVGLKPANIVTIGELQNDVLQREGEHIAIEPVEGIENEYIIKVKRDFERAELCVVAGDEIISVWLTGGVAMPVPETIEAPVETFDTVMEMDSEASKETKVDYDVQDETMVGSADDANENARAIALDFSNYIATDAHSVYMYDGAMAAVLVDAADIADADGVAVTVSDANDHQVSGVMVIDGDGEYIVNGIVCTVSGLVLPEKSVTNDAQNVTIATANDEATLYNVEPVFEQTSEGYSDIFSLFAQDQGESVPTARLRDVLFGTAFAEEARTLSMRLFNIGLQNTQTGEAVEPDGTVHVMTSFDGIEGTDFKLYHIVNSQPVLIENAVVEHDGCAVGFDFYIDSLSPFALVYYTVTARTGEVYTGYTYSTFERTLNAQRIIEDLGIQAIATGVACADGGIRIDGLDIILPEGFTDALVRISTGLDIYEVKLLMGHELTATAGDYAVTLDLSGAGLDEGRTYKVVIEQAPATAEQLAAVEAALSQTLESGIVRAAHVSGLEMVDIAIVDAQTGEAVEPDGAVAVTLTRGGEAMPSVVHIRGDGSAEVLTAVDGTFVTESFSAFTGAYTVDFQYEGYQWSFPGENGYRVEDILVLRRYHRRTSKRRA